MVSLAGQEGGMCQGDPAGAVFLLPPGMLGSSSALSFQLPAPPPPQSLNQQIITLTLQMFNFLLQLHQFCSRRGGRGNKRKQAGSFQINPELL